MTYTNFLEHLTLMLFDIDQLGTKNTEREVFKSWDHKSPLQKVKILMHSFPMVIYSLWPAQHLAGIFVMERKGIKAMPKAFVS